MAERSVTRAAHRLMLSQSALSGALARLRHAINDQLFVRGSGGLVPTSAALALAEPVANALREIDQALEQCSSFAPSQSVLKITMHGDDHILPHVLPVILPVVQLKAPNLSLNVSPTNLDSLEHLKDGRADLLITGLSKGLPDYLKAMRLYRQRLVGIADRNRFKPRHTVTLSEFVAAEHVAYHLPSGMGVAGVDRELSKLGLSRHIKVTVGSPMTVPLVVQSTGLLGVLPEPAAKMAANTVPLRIFPLPFDVPEAYVTMVWHERVHHNAGHRWLRQQITEMKAAL